MCKMGGRCFLLSQFSGFSTAIEDWENTISVCRNILGHFSVQKYNVHLCTLKDLKIIGYSPVF